MWPIKNFEKYFIAHQYMPKIFHDPHKNSPAPSYILNVPSLTCSNALTNWFFWVLINKRMCFYWQHLVQFFKIVNYDNDSLKKHSWWKLFYTTLLMNFYTISYQYLQLHTSRFKVISLIAHWFCKSNTCVVTKFNLYAV